MDKNVCSCHHHKAIPGLVILFGLVFLLGAFGTLSAQTVMVAWPVLVIIGGVFKLMEGNCKCC